MSSIPLGNVDIKIPKELVDTFGSGNTLKMNKYFKYLFYAGFGLCVILIFILIISILISFGTDEIEEEEPGKIGEHDETGESSESSDEYTLFPGLFKEPITLFERDIDTKIRKTSDEIDKLEDNTQCYKYNEVLEKSPANKYVENYNKAFKNCGDDDGCLINASYLMGTCINKDDKVEKGKCQMDYINNFMEFMKNKEVSKYDGLCGVSCSYTPHDKDYQEKNISQDIDTPILCFDDSVHNKKEELDMLQKQKKKEIKGYKISIG